MAGMRFVVGALRLLVVVATLIMPAQAGPLDKLLGGGGPEGAASPESVVNMYIGATQTVLRSQERLLKAVGKGEAAAKAALQAENLKEGATKQNLEEAALVQTENSKALEEALKAGGTVLDQESKVVYAQGLATLGRGVRQYYLLILHAKTFRPGLNLLGSLGMLNAALFVVNSLPTTSSSLTSTLSLAVQFAQSQGVEVPEDATAALT
jgi:hypothetical protein